MNNSVYTYVEDHAPKLIDAQVGNKSSDGHDYRSDFTWIIAQGYEWIITDTADDWHARLEKQGLRNISHLIANGCEASSGRLAQGWYKA